jgi:copper chaperone
MTAAGTVPTDRRTDRGVFTMDVTTTVTVEGMTCGHCVNAVESELAAIAGVTAVRVDLATGVVDITSNTVLDRSAIEEAIDEAGYRLVR